MLDKYQHIYDTFEAGEKKYRTSLQQMANAVTEIHEHSLETIKDLENADKVIQSIDSQFAQQTGITNPKDMAFLWGAVALQCIRWIIIPTFDIDTLSPTVEDRKDSALEGKKDPTATGKQLDKSKAEREKQVYPDVNNIMMLPVPYDAMKGTEDIVIPGVTDEGKQIYSMNHHSATLGHDPILGQFFGTANIMTRSITFHDSSSTTRKVEIPKGRTQVVVKEPAYSIRQMIQDVYDSFKEDNNRLKAALIKENLHLQSDKYTKTGLPIPLLSAALQQQLLDEKWNSKELEDVIVGASRGIKLNAVVSLIINSIIGILHRICYDEQQDEYPEVYKVRTEKILMVSASIAECLNIGAVAIGGVEGVLSENPDVIRKAICHLDIGGIIEAIHQIAWSRKIQEQIRREYLEKELFNHFAGNEYSFLGG